MSRLCANMPVNLGQFIIMKDLADPNRPVVPVSYPRLLLELVEEHGISRDTLLAGTLVSAASLDAPGGRLTPAEFVHMVVNAWHLTKNPALGYEFGLRTRLTAHGFLGYAVISCATLNDALLLCEKFLPLRTQALAMQHYVDGDSAVMEFTEKFDLGPMRQFTFDSLLIGLERAGRFLLGDYPGQAEIWFDYPEPDYYAAWRDRLPRMHFDKPAIQLRFPVAALKQPLVMSDPISARLAVEQCERELALLGEVEDFSTRVRAVLASAEDVYPDLENVASRLFVSGRTLKRKLQQQGTTFQEILDDVRCRDATRLLENPRLSLEQIARHLGYADPANFTRAFRKWTGHAPSHFRQRQPS